MTTNRPLLSTVAELKADIAAQTGGLHCVGCMCAGVPAVNQKPPRSFPLLSLASLAADASLSYVPCSLRRCAGGESEGPSLPLAPLDALSDSHVRIPTSLFMCAGVPAENQKLLFKGQLKDEQTLQVSVAVWAAG